MRDKRGEGLGAEGKGERLVEKEGRKEKTKFK